MAKKIRVVLLENVRDVGQAGEVVEVAEGFARNSLFPEGKAALATKGQQRQLQTQKEIAAKKEAEHLVQLQEKAEAFSGTELTLTARVKDGDEIFGSITNRTICEELKNQASFTCHPRDIVLLEPITKLGSYDITVRLSEEVETSIRVTIAADPDTVPSETE